MRKDLRICLQTAARIGATLPVTAAIEEMYAEMQRRGASRLDATSIIRLRRD
jgi:3-hydroxyisobutyrate dehydrogenase-like beta-hydroxyacid dehydrogenase